MMMKRIKRLIAAVLCIAATLLCAGCGNNSAGTGSANQSSNTASFVSLTYGGVISYEKNSALAGKKTYSSDGFVITENTYDDKCNLVQMKLYTFMQSSGDGLHFEFEYDDSSNLIKETCYTIEDGVSQEVHSTATYNYDGDKIAGAEFSGYKLIPTIDDELRREVYSRGDSSVYTLTYSYDSDNEVNISGDWGNITYSLSENGQISEYTCYDENGQLSLEFTFGENGNITGCEETCYGSSESYNLVYTNSYGPNGRINETSYTATRSGQEEELNLDIAYAHGGEGRVKAIIINVSTEDDKKSYDGYFRYYYDGTILATITGDVYAVFDENGFVPTNE